MTTRSTPRPWNKTALRPQPGAPHEDDSSLSEACGGFAEPGTLGAVRDNSPSWLSIRTGNTERCPRIEDVEVRTANCTNSLDSNLMGWIHKTSRIPKQSLPIDCGRTCSRPGTLCFLEAVLPSLQTPSKLSLTLPLTLLPLINTEILNWEKVLLCGGILNPEP